MTRSTDMKSSDECRDAFEKWAVTAYDKYTLWDENIQEQCFKAWQAAWNTRQSEEGCQYPYVKIGKYNVAAYPEYIWIGIDGDGEGGGFEEAKLEAVIEMFYGENF